MRKRSARLVPSISFLLFLVMALWRVSQSNETTAEGAKISFADSNLEAVVREQVGKPSGDLYQKDLAAIKVLDTGHKEIWKLNGIENCINLISLRISDEHLSDLSPLAHLAGLEELYLPSCCYPSFTGHDHGAFLAPLSGLTQLRKLDLRWNDLVDISPLASLVNLSELNISHSRKLKDLTPLRKMKQLRKLDLSQCNFDNILPLPILQNLEELDLHDNDKLEHVSALTNLLRLTRLDLSSTLFSDWRSLSGLHELRELNIRGTPRKQNLTPLNRLTKMEKLVMDGDDALTNYSTLAKMTALRELTLTSPSTLAGIQRLYRIEKLEIQLYTAVDFFPLRSLKNLRELNISCWHEGDPTGSCDLDLSPLAHLTSVEKLNLTIYDGKLDLMPLRSMISLKELDLFWNSSPPSLAPLASLTRLKKLTFEVAVLSDLSPIGGLHQLEDLEFYLSRAPLDPQVFQGLENMSKLILTGAKFKDLAWLAKMTKIQELVLIQDGISDITPLAELKHLTVLDLSENQVRDLTPIAGLTGLHILVLSNNQISNLGPLVQNSTAGGLGKGDYLVVEDNPLDAPSAQVLLPSLRSKGVLNQAPLPFHSNE
jgi:internalin A